MLVLCYTPAEPAELGGREELHPPPLFNFGKKGAILVFMKKKKITNFHKCFLSFFFHVFKTEKESPSGSIKNLFLFQLRKIGEIGDSSFLGKNELNPILFKVQFF